MTASQDDDEGDTLLMRSIKAKQWHQVRDLLVLATKAGDQQQADGNTIRSMLQALDSFDNTALHAAIGYQAADDILFTILHTYPQATQIHGANSWLPLHVAAMYGVSANVMEALIRTFPQGLDDVGEGGIKGRSPRHFRDRFAHNQALLSRSTDEWMRIIRMDEPDDNQSNIATATADDDDQSGILF